MVHSCEKCKKVSLIPFECAMSKGLDFPEKEKVFFIDDRMIIHTPPKGSSVWSITTPQLPSESSSEHPAQSPVLVPVAELETAA